MAKRKRGSSSRRRVRLGGRRGQRKAGALDGSRVPLAAGDRGLGIDGPGGLDGPELLDGPQTTGRLIVTFLDRSAEGGAAGLQAIKEATGLASVCPAKDFQAAESDPRQSERADVTYRDELGIGIVRGDPGRIRAMATATSSGVSGLVVEPEYVNAGRGGSSGHGGTPEMGWSMPECGRAWRSARTFAAVRRHD